MPVFYGRIYNTDPIRPALCPLAPFSGLPGENSAHFTYRLALHLTEASRFTLTEAYPISCASSFLAGPALDWFLALLRRNAELCVNESRARLHDQAQDEYERGARAERPAPLEEVVLQGQAAYEWISHPYKIPEFESLRAFLQALEAAFPCRATETRSATPTSEATLTW